MYIAQVPRTPGVHLAGIADVSPANARASLERVGWKPEQYAAASLDAALKERRTHVSDDWRALVAHPAVEIVVEATGNPTRRSSMPSLPSETASTCDGDSRRDRRSAG